MARETIEILHLLRDDKLTDRAERAALAEAINALTERVTLEKAIIQGLRETRSLEQRVVERDGRILALEGALLHHLAKAAPRVSEDLIARTPEAPDGFRTHSNHTYDERHAWQAGWRAGYEAALRERPAPEPCVVSDLSSRVCERGTYNCDVRHEPAATTGIPPAVTITPMSPELQAALDGAPDVHNIVNMPEPVNIDTTLDTLQAAWKAHPQLRLLQLLLNVVTDDDFAHGYYLTDDKVSARLRTLYLQASDGPEDPPCRNDAPADDSRS